VANQNSDIVAAGSVWTMRLALGFATTVALWAVSYVTLMGPGLAVGEVLVGVMMLIVAFGGFLGGRCRAVVAPRGSAVVAGLWIGLVSAVFNLLIVGGVFPQDASAIEKAGFLLGLLVVSSVLGAIGGAIGGRKRAFSIEGMPRPFGLYAAVLPAAILLLLMTGSLVTALEAGLAVPDWPNSFGHNMLLYPIRDMEGAVFFEHAHRLFGMLVGFGSIGLAVLVFLNDKRCWLRALCVALLVAVSAQGLMGGLRVTEISTAWAIVHGVFGQLIFVVALLITTFSRKRWIAMTTPVVNEEAANDRPLSMGLLFAVIAQLVLGAFLRHLQVLGDDGTSLVLPHWALMTHITVGLVVVALALGVGVRLGWDAKHDHIVRHLARVVLGLVIFQLLMGFAALVVVMMRDAATPPVSEVVVTSMHQTIGALILAVTAMLVVWQRRLEAPSATD
jgi:cytochrome c oxidase assembly protein subunit 15